MLTSKDSVTEIILYAEFTSLSRRKINRCHWKENRKVGIYRAGLPRPPAERTGHQQYRSRGNYAKFVGFTPGQETLQMNWNLWLDTQTSNCFLVFFLAKRYSIYLIGRENVTTILELKFRESCCYVL